MPRHLRLSAASSILLSIATAGPSLAQTAERLVVERVDGVTQNVLLQVIRSLGTTGSELLVHTTDGGQLHFPFASIRRLRFEPSTTGLEPDGQAWVEAIRLLQNRPNPAPGPTTIGFDLARRGPVTLEIFSVSGRRLRTLLDRVLEPGHHDVAWDGADDRGHRVEAGVYFYRLRGLGADRSRRAIVLP